MLTDRLAYAASRKGWITVQYDQSVWIPCLPVFPSGLGRGSWARLYAEHWWEARGLEHGHGQVAALERSLIALHEIAYSELPCHEALIHLPDPRMVPLLVCLGVWQAEGDRMAQLRELAHADEPGAVQPPIVEQCRTDRLGDGLKSLCYLRSARGSRLSGCLNYAWRSEELQTAVRLSTCCPDMGRLQRAMPDIDALTRVISFVSR